MRDITRQIAEADLSSPGVQQLLLEQMERAEDQCDALEAYVQRYHEADKKASVLEERMSADRSIEISFGVGVGVGSAIIGLAPFFWEPDSNWGQLTLVVGLILVVGATIARAVNR